MIGEGRGGDVKVALEEELAAREGAGRGALAGEGEEALESGEERREESVKKRVLGPKRGFGERRKRGLERGEFCSKNLPPSDEGLDGDGGEEEEGEDVCY